MSAGSVQGNSAASIILDSALHVVVTGSGGEDLTAVGDTFGVGDAVVSLGDVVEYEGGGVM